MSKNLKGCYSHNSDDWKTPKKMYHFYVIDKGYIDPCEYKAKYNGLARTYKKTNLFINPPYSKIAEWVEWAIEQCWNGCKVVMLIPARTDTKYFSRILTMKPEIRFILGRLKFEKEDGAKLSAPFPSLLIYMDGTNLTTKISTTYAKEWNS